jgi:hypothetical protein
VPAPTGPSAPSAVLEHIAEGTDIVVPLANGEPVALLDAIEAAAASLSGVRVHQMHALRQRGYLDGRHGDRLRHVSYFLSHITRPHMHAGGLDLVPAHFSEVPLLLDRTVRKPLILAASSLPDRHGFFSLGTNADYVARFVGRWPVFLEANARMPRTFGNNMAHVSQLVGWTEVDEPLIEVPPSEPDDLDRSVAELIAERVPDRATIQATGISGSTPSSCPTGWWTWSRPEPSPASTSGGARTRW